ncbi:RNA-binding protein, partial [Streptococcus pneumoniae]
MALKAETTSINTLRKSLQTTSASPYLLTASVLFTT